MTKVRLGTPALPLSQVRKGHNAPFVDGLRGALGLA
jgi:hypothetical protein